MARQASREDPRSGRHGFGDTGDSWTCGLYEPVSDADLIASDLVYPHVRGETSSVEYRPGHRWYYFSDMQPDEALLIRVHDSAEDGRARLSFHTSFDNPLAADAPPRESIEVRTLVFFQL